MQTTRSQPSQAALNQHTNRGKDGINGAEQGKESWNRQSTKV